MKKGWEIKKLGEVCKTGAGGTPLKSHKEFYEGGTVPWLLSGEVSQGNIYSAQNFITKEGLKNSSAKVFPVNTVLVAMYGATAGQVGILRFQAATNQAVCGIYPNDKILPEFIFYFFLNVKEKLISQATGNAQPNISQIKIKNTFIPLPPLSEQKQIVAVLDKAFAAIDRAKANVERNLQNARELFQSKLNEIFSQKGEGWEERRFGDICEFVRGPFGGSLKKSIFVDDGIAVYEQQHAIYHQFEKVRYFITEEKYNEMKRFEVKPGDLIMSCSGTMGRVAIVPENVKQGIINQALLKLSPKRTILKVEYLKRWMESDVFLKEIEKHSSGAAIKNIASVKVLKEIQVPLPQLDMQTEVVITIDIFEEKTSYLVDLYNKKINNLENLKKSLLQKAFAGELIK